MINLINCYQSHDSVFRENLFIIDPLLLQISLMRTRKNQWPYLRKNKEENGQYYALAIGFCVISGAYGVGVLSGGAFNPAVAFALDVTSALGPTSGVGEFFTQHGDFVYPEDPYMVYLPTFGYGKWC